MVSVDSSGRIRFSTQLVKSAGFRPGQQIAVVADGRNSFTIMPASKVSKSTESARYSVEQDGRVRVSKSVLSELGVRAGKRKKLGVDARKGSINVSL